MIWMLNYLDVGEAWEDCAQTDPMPMDSSESDADVQEHLGKDFSALADMYWVFFFSILQFFPSESMASL